MIFRLKAIGEHIIYINFHGMPNLLNTHTIYQPVIGGSCVLEFKVHNIVVIKTSINDESGFFFVKFMHSFFIIS